ncbi:MAG TPA: hypothetical protein VFA45_06385 [Actinomycetes bacterium]|jgi:hypothetical protein|nr:hypothetical protein [Actinomycetes bacterium]
MAHADWIIDLGPGAGHDRGIDAGAPVKYPRCAPPQRLCAGLQVGGQVVTFLTEHLGNQIPSPALFGPIGDRFRAAVTRFASAYGIPVVRFEKEQRKAEVMRPLLEAAANDGVSRWSRLGGAGVPAGVLRL